MKIHIETPRLLLRRLQDGDQDALFDFIQHPAVQAAVPEMQADGTGIIEYVTKHQAWKTIDPGGCFDLAIHHKKDNILIGIVSIVMKAGATASIGYALNQRYWRKGLATEAAAFLTEYCFNELGATSVEAETEAANEPSWRVMQRVGFEPRPDTPDELVVYAVSRASWEARK